MARIAWTTWSIRRRMAASSRARGGSERRDAPRAGPEPPPGDAAGHPLPLLTPVAVDTSTGNHLLPTRRDGGPGRDAAPGSATPDARPGRRVWSDGAVKVRFGVGLPRDAGPAELPAIVDRLEAAGVDSIWFSEAVFSPQVDPFVGMAHALARTVRLKAGTGVAILPGRHPVLVAKQLASLAALAPRRVLPVFGLRPANPAERPLFPVPGGARGAAFDEALRLLRALLERPSVSFAGRHHAVASAGISPRPDPPLDLWVAGSAPAALRRAGRLADGWLGSFLTPAEAGRAREAIEAAAREAGRTIEPDHYGISLTVAVGGIPPELAAMARARRPDLDPSELIADGWPRLHRLLDGYLEAGLTKFVIRPAGRQTFAGFLDRFLAELVPRQS